MNTLKEKALVYRKELVFGGLLFLVSTLSFAFGYVTNRGMNHAPIVIEACVKQ